MLPWGPDGKWVQEGVIGKVLGDWQVTGVVLGYLWNTDRLHRQRDGSARAWQLEYAERLGERPKCSAASARANLWFDTSVFSAPSEPRGGMWSGAVSWMVPRTTTSTHRS